MDTPIIKETYDLYKVFYQYLEFFPKKARYSLGQRCENYILDFLELIILAASLPKEKKLVELQKANVKFDVLKILLRLTKDIKALDNKEYIVLQSHVQKIGKMLGGWMKSVK